MTRQCRKEKQSDLAKPGFSFDQCALLNPDFSYTLQRRSAPVWGSHVCFNLRPQITRGHNYIRQYTINGRTVSSVRFDFGKEEKGDEQGQKIERSVKRSERTSFCSVEKRSKDL
jgi:hypothetical protein